MSGLYKLIFICLHISAHELTFICLSIIVSPTTLSPAATPVPTVVSTAAEEEEEVSISLLCFKLESITCIELELT